MTTPSSHLSPRSTRFFIILGAFCLILMLCAGGIITYRIRFAGRPGVFASVPILKHVFAQPAQLAPTNRTSTGGKVATPTPTGNPSMPYTIHDDGTVQTFSGFGITIKLGDNDGVNAHGNKINIAGNMIYVGDLDSSGKSSYFIQLFAKHGSDTVQSIIGAQILTQYSSADCPLTQYQQKTTGYEVTRMSYASTSLDISKCPSMYAAPEDIRYFLFDPKHPTLFIFISAGQTPIDNQPDGQTWLQTISFI